MDREKEYHAINRLKGIEHGMDFLNAVLARLKYDYNKEDIERVVTACVVTSFVHPHYYTEWEIIGLIKPCREYGCWIEDVRQAFETADYSFKDEPQICAERMKGAWYMVEVLIFELTFLQRQKAKTP